MTNAHSKLFQSVDISCEKFQHPWTDKCTNATAGLILTSLPYCLRIYAIVYLISLAMRFRIPSLKDLKKTVLGILQSTGFLVTNAFTFVMYNCIIRQILGCYYASTVAFIPSFLSSWTAIVFERPARRPMLALYVANIATETLWNMAERRGLVRSIPHGQAMIFGVGVSILLYLYRLGWHKTHCKDSLFNILQIFVDKTEAGPIKSIDASTTATRTSRRPLNFGRINVIVQLYARLMDAVKIKHETCPHKRGCIQHALFGGIKPFIGGVSLQIALKTLMNVKKIAQMRFDWRKTLFDKNSLKLGIFLGGFSLLYKAVSCSLRHSFGYDDPKFAIPAGLIGSIMFTQYPDTTVALYVFWKMLQIVYNLGIQRGVLPKVPGFTLFLYSFCTATLFHAGILEAGALRPSYYKFLQNISGERLSKFNVTEFDVFGMGSSATMAETLKKLNIVNKSPLPQFSMAF